jgi:hypothetical protein
VKTQYHRSITAQALSLHFGQNALETVIAANLGQDAWQYQFGHDHFHYDNNSFATGDAYLDELRRSVMDALQHGEAVPARKSFGRLTHAAQDFYAHSNYIALWRESHPRGEEEIDPLLAALLTDSRLRSGRIYYPWEVFAFIPVLKPHVLPLLPRDSHAWMNIDDPSRPDFDYAYAAAVKRTKLEFERICQTLSPEQIHMLTGLKPKGLPDFPACPDGLTG